MKFVLVFLLGLYVGTGIFGQHLVGALGQIGENAVGQKISTAQETIKETPVVGDLVQWFGKTAGFVKNKATEPSIGETRDGVTYIGKFSGIPQVVCNKFGVFGSQWCGLAVPSTQ